MGSNPCVDGVYRPADRIKQKGRKCLFSLCRDFHTDPAEIIAVIYMADSEAKRCQPAAVVVFWNTKTVGWNTCKVTVCDIVVGLLWRLKSVLFPFWVYRLLTPWGGMLATKSGIDPKVSLVATTHWAMTKRSEFIWAKSQKKQTNKKNTTLSGDHPVLESTPSACCCHGNISDHIWINSAE